MRTDNRRTRPVHFAVDKDGRAYPPDAFRWVTLNRPDSRRTLCAADADGAPLRLAVNRTLVTCPTCAARLVDHALTADGSPFLR